MASLSGWGVDRLLRVSLTFVQRYLLHHQPALYSSIRHDVAARLPKLKIFVVDKGTLKVTRKHEIHSVRPRTRHLACITAMRSAH